MNGGRLFLGWVAFVIGAYILALVFIVPPTEGARAAASALFALCGIITAVCSFILWRARR